MSIPADERALTNVVDWAGGHDEWEGFRAEIFGAHFEPIMAELDLPDDALLEALGPEGELVFTAVMEDFLGSWFGEDGERNVVDEYLASRGWLEKKQGVRYLRAIRDAPPSLFEVVALDPGGVITVRDLVRESDPFRVRDEYLSETLVPWDCFVARLMGAGRARRFGVGLLQFPRELADGCLKDLNVLAKRLRTQFRRDARKRGKTENLDLAEARHLLLLGPTAGVFFTTMFVNWHVRRRAAGPPALKNTDDESLVLSIVRFPIAGSEADIAATLDGLPEFDRDGPDPSWSWRGRELPAAAPKELAGADPEVGPGYLTLGMAEVVDGALQLHVNSVERAERGRELLASRLGALVGTPLTSHEDPAARLPGGRSEPGAGEEEPDIPPEEMEAVIGTFLEGHYRKVLDEPVPMLGNRSPRGAARTKKGRAAVVEWLKALENSELRQAAETGRKPFDTGWLWEELKIPRPGGKP